MTRCVQALAAAILLLEAPLAASAQGSLSVADVTISEASPSNGEISSQPLTGTAFVVTLSPAGSEPVSVGYATQAGSASAGSGCGGSVDLVAVQGTLQFAPGQTRLEIPIEVCPDSQVESDETFQLVLSQATGATISDGQATGRILDDDEIQSVSLTSVSVAGVSVGEGDPDPGARPPHAEFTVSVSPAPSQPLTVAYATRDETARGGPACGRGIDYVHREGSLVFQPGTTQQRITVPICPDDEDEPNESFRLAPTPMASGSVSEGTGTILNDDAEVALFLTIADAAGPEGTPPSQVPLGTPDGGGIVFVVTLSAPGDAKVGVDYATRDGSARGGRACGEGVDFVIARGQLRFDPGTARQEIPIALCPDADSESDESFEVALSNPTGATVRKGTAKGTIRNDDTTIPGRRR